MILRHCIFLFAVAVFAAQPFGSANAQIPVHVQEEIIQLEPAHTAVDFMLGGKLHTTNGHFALKPEPFASILLPVMLVVKSS
jgi:hypothetical protein